MRVLPLILPVLMLVFVHATRQPESPHGNEFKVPCSNCHSAKGWELDPEVYSFDHNTTRMPLAGQHNLIGCRQCHTSLVFSEAETDCYLCHVDLHEQTLGNDCGRCHTPHSWIVNNVTEIHRQGRFPLLGAHLMAECTSCHQSASLLRFEPLGVECVDCHMADYQATSSPNHVESNLSTECADCHSMMAFSWGSESFTHQFFPLTQGHSGVDCAQCHELNDFANVSTECYACHQEDYLATVNPAHQAAGYSTECMSCHTTLPGWRPATFDHTSFPLSQGHSGVDCAQCHDMNDFTSVSPECYACHEQDYQATVNPGHQAAGFSTECMECHTTLPGWKPATFDHNSFPLTLGHAGVNCTQCHDLNDYSNVASECYACHQEDYQATVNPGHQAAGFSTECMECHTTLPGWKPATFDHNSFALTLGHAELECAQCHDLMDYSNISSECYACHQEDYNNTSNPDHVAADISINCLECHTTMPDWKPAEFPIHDAQFFPIYSGDHRGEWDSCTQCHQDLNNYASFTCLTCHEHSQSSMDDKHSEEPDYIYNSVACLECHPTGNGD